MKKARRGTRVDEVGVRKRGEETCLPFDPVSEAKGSLCLWSTVRPSPVSRTLIDAVAGRSCGASYSCRQRKKTEARAKGREMVR